ncbi:hypothetical protein [Paenibacillus herberti]|uniref:hypothetical protein n=1 Tax=Paenibacillus herberti TaxID=1619309 RepID=UPI001595ED51|nr:hypothetical protein [Paenibacillus herberti]
MALKSKKSTTCKKKSNCKALRKLLGMSQSQTSFSNLTILWVNTNGVPKQTSANVFAIILDANNNPVGVAPFDANGVAVIAEIPVLTTVSYKLAINMEGNVLRSATIPSNVEAFVVIG